MLISSQSLGKTISTTYALEKKRQAAESLFGNDGDDSDDESDESEDELAIREAERERVRNMSSLTETTALAVYWHHGAELRMPQRRNPPAGKVDGIWCNPRAGVWKHFPAVPGRAARSHAFSVKMLEDGRKRAQLRRACGKKIAKEVARGIARVRVPALLALIEEGEALSGSRLVIDCNNARAFLAHNAPRVLLASRRRGAQVGN